MVSMKSINILAGEDGKIPSALSIIPFPSLNMKGLVKSMEIKDKKIRIDPEFVALLAEFGESSAFYAF